MRHILVILFLSVILLGCGKKEGNKPEDINSKLKVDTTAIKTSPVDNPNQKFDIRYKFEKGKNYFYRVASFTQDDLTIRADSTVNSKLKQSVIYLLTLNLSNVDKDGVMEFNTEIKSIHLTAEVDGQFFSYQSSGTKDSTELRKYAEYEAMVNNPFSMRIGKLGGILEIFRSDKVVNKFIELREPGNSLNSAQRDAARNYITESLLRPLVLQIFREMPSNTVAKDSSWSYTQPAVPFMIFKLENTNLFKVSGLEKYNSDTLAIITAGLKTVVTGDTKYEERGTKVNFNKPTTSAGGTIYFNVSKGCIQKSNIKTQIHIFFTMEKGRQKGNKTEEITSTNILELL